MILSLLATSLLFTPIAPFTGAQSEGFETQGVVVGQACVTGGIFGGAGDLCTDNGNGSYVSTALTGTSCTVNPHAGSWLGFSSPQGATTLQTTITFDEPVTRFGGYFANVNAVYPGYFFWFDFYAEDGTFLESWLETADCTWGWHGWDFSPYFPVGSVVITSYGATPTGIIMDDLECDPVTTVQPGVDTCFPGVGSNAACPCLNPPPALGLGCEHSSHGYGLLTSSGVASLASDTVVFAASDCDLSSSIGLYTGPVMAGAAFGSGVKCYSGSIGYLYVGTTSGSGAYAAPTGAQASVSARHAARGDTLSSGTVRMYQFLYRMKQVLPHCSAGSDYNYTQGQYITWAP